MPLKSCAWAIAGEMTPQLKVTAAHREIARREKDIQHSLEIINKYLKTNCVIVASEDDFRAKFVLSVRG